MNMGLVIGVRPLSSIAVGIIPQFDFLWNIEKSLKVIRNSDIDGQDTNMDNPTSAVADCYTDWSPPYGA